MFVQKSRNLELVDDYRIPSRTHEPLFTHVLPQKATCQGFFYFGHKLLFKEITSTIQNVVKCMHSLCTKFYVEGKLDSFIIKLVSVMVIVISCSF